MAKEASSTTHDDEYWTDVTITNGVFGPLVKVLRMGGSDDKTEMVYLYKAMDRTKESIRKHLEVCWL